jgi:hypothetical protein
MICRYLIKKLISVFHKLYLEEFLFLVVTSTKHLFKPSIIKWANYLLEMCHLAHATDTVEHVKNVSPVALHKFFS